MKATQVRAKTPEVSQEPCVVCGTPTYGYGSWLDGKTCSRKCEDTHKKRSFYGKERPEPDGGGQEPSGETDTVSSV